MHTHGEQTLPETDHSNEKEKAMTAEIKNKQIMKTKIIILSLISKYDSGIDMSKSQNPIDGGRIIQLPWFKTQTEMESSQLRQESKLQYPHSASDRDSIGMHRGKYLACHRFATTKICNKFYTLLQTNP